MLLRFLLFCALTGALLTLSPSSTLALSESQQDAAIASLQNAVAALQSDNATLKSSVTTLQSTVKNQASTLASLQSQVNTLKSLTSGFSRVTDLTRTDGKKGTELFLTGFNLHVVNGLGATNGNPSIPYASDTQDTAVNGLGNVIIGYNAPIPSQVSNPGVAGGPSPADVRTGSHNLVIGDGENYSSFGGLVIGVENVISAPFATAIGGSNTASGYGADVSGGFFNIASGDGSAVSGGINNKASGAGAGISGGSDNVAGNSCSGVSGGHGNTASGAESCVSGGQDNTASGYYSSVSGGYLNTASGGASSVSGGTGNTAGGSQSSIGGGLFLLDNDIYSFAAGGQYTQVSPGPGALHSP